LSGLTAIQNARRGACPHSRTTIIHLQRDVAAATKANAESAPSQLAKVYVLAERVRFELTSPVKGLRFSRPVQSTALPPLHLVTQPAGHILAGVRCALPDSPSWQRGKTLATAV
jgi:hypothetical protein